MITIPANNDAAAADAAAQDAAIQANALALANITGQDLGFADTFAGLPVTADSTDGDWATLNADDIGTGTELVPQYPQGVYRYDGSAYVFAYATSSAASNVVASEVISADTTVNAASAIRLWVDTSANDITLTLDMAENQRVDIHNTGEGRVTLIANPAFINGATAAYLTAKGDHVEIIRQSAAYYAA